MNHFPFSQVFFLSFIHRWRLGWYVFCSLCGFSNFRTSRFRFKMQDLAQLLLLRLPVRCLNCDERAFTSLKNYLAVRRVRRERHRVNPSTS